MPTTVRYLVKKDRLDGSQSVEDLYSRIEISTRPVLWNQYTKDYLVFESRQELADWYVSVPESDRYYHEVIFGFLPQHLHFDIDAPAHKLESLPAVAESESTGDDLIDELLADIEVPAQTAGAAAIMQLMNRLIDAILDELYTGYYCIEDLMPTRDDIIVTDSSGLTTTGYKYSFHIVTTYVVADNEETKEFTNRVLERISPIMRGFIDQSVCKKVQNFRLIGSTKPGTSRYKRVTDIFNTIADASFDQMLVTAPSAVHILPKIYASEAEIPELIVLRDTIIQAALDVVTQSGVILGHTFKEARGMLLCFVRNLPSHCRICNEKHHHDNSLIVNIIPGAVVNTSTQCQIVEYCRQVRGKCRTIGEISIPTTELKFTQVPVALHAPIAIENKLDQVNTRISAIRAGNVNPHISSVFEQLPDVQKTIYAENAMRPYELVPTLAVRAQMKLGKTKAMRTYLTKNFASGGLNTYVVRFVTFRQTFSNSIAKDFPDFELYSNIVGDIDHIQHPRVIIQVESLHRLKIGLHADHIDLLVLDEAESIFAQFNSGLHKHFNAAFAAFQWMLQTAQHVVCMDANLGDRTHNTLARLRPTHLIHFHWNRFARAADDKYHFTTDQATWLGQLYTALRNDNRIVLPTNSLAEAKAYEEAIRREFPKKCVMLYSSETSQSEKVLHFGDVHTYWSRLDVLIFTPTCSAGVSFELEHFDILFGYFCDTSCDVETCRQMLGRVRNIRTQEHYICLSGKGSTLPETTADIERLLRNKRAGYYKSITDTTVQFEYTTDGNIHFYESNYYYLWLETVRINNLSRNNFIKRFIDQVADTGANINVLPTDESEVGAALLSVHRDTREELHETRCNAIANAAVITPDEASIIRDALSAPVGQPDVEPEMRLAYDKFQLCETYKWHEKPIDMKFVQNYQDYGTRRVYRNLQQITATPTISESLRQIHEQEAYQYNYIMEVRSDVNESRDLVRDKSLYTFRAHFTAVWLLQLCGFKCITDQSRIHEMLMESRLRNGFSLIRRNMDNIVFEFEIQRPNLDKLSRDLDCGRFLSGMLRMINAVLRIMYGIQIRRVPKQAGGGAYQIGQSTVGKLFAFTPNEKCPYIKSNLVPVSSQHVRVDAFIEDMYYGMPET